MQEAIVGLQSTRPRKGRSKSQAVTVTRNISSYFRDPSASMTPVSSSTSQWSSSSSEGSFSEADDSDSFSEADD